MTALSANISTATVRGQFLSALISPSDSDGIPDDVGLSSLLVKISATTPFVVDLAASPNAKTYILPTYNCTVNTAGYLCGPNGAEGVNLICNDDPDIAPHGTWQYKIEYSGPAGADKLSPTQINVPVGSPDIWLSGLATVPGSTIITLTEAQAAQAGAVASASTATAQAGAAATSATAAAASATAAAASAATAVTSDTNATTQAGLALTRATATTASANAAAVSAAAAATSATNATATVAATNTAVTAATTAANAATANVTTLTTTIANAQLLPVLTTGGATRTLALSDAAVCLSFSGATCTITIPTNTAVVFPLGTVITGQIAHATGVLTITPASGVTIVKKSSTPLVFGDQWSAFTLLKRATNEWHLSHDGV